MKRIPPKLQPWFEARKRFRLSHAHIQMARELGMNPKKFGSLANHRQEPWKMPLPEFIAECYRKRFHRSVPENVLSLEELIQKDEIKRKAKQAQKADKKLAQVNSAGFDVKDHSHLPSNGKGCAATLSDQPDEHIHHS